MNEEQQKNGSIEPITSEEIIGLLKEALGTDDEAVITEFLRSRSFKAGLPHLHGAMRLIAAGRRGKNYSNLIVKKCARTTVQTARKSARLSMKAARRSARFSMKAARKSVRFSVRAARKSVRMSLRAARKSVGFSLRTVKKSARAVRKSVRFSTRAAIRSSRVLRRLRFLRRLKLGKKISSFGVSCVLKLLNFLPPQQAIKLYTRLNRDPASKRRSTIKLLHMRLILNNGWEQPRVGNYGKIDPEKVVFALHNSYPHDGAGYASRSHAILTNLVKAGIQCTACTRPGYPWDLLKHREKPLQLTDMLDGVEYRRLVPEGVKLGLVDRDFIDAYGRELAAVGNNQGARLFHAASNYINGLAAVRAAAETGGKAIYEMRGLWHLTRISREPWLEGTDQLRYFQISEHAAAAQADALVCISEALKNKMIKDGINPNKITVVPNCVDASLFQPRQPDKNLLRRLGLEGRKVIGFIGSLTGYEGLELIMEATLALNQQGIPASFVIVGDGPYAEELQTVHQELGAPQEIIFTGRVPFTEVGKYYSIANVLPFPRSNFEVCRYVPPLKILEAMCMDKNVIVSDLPPLVEIVQANKTGLVCKPDDLDSLVEALGQILDNPDQAKIMAQNAHDWVMENRDWAKMVQRYVNLYQKLA